MRAPALLVLLAVLVAFSIAKDQRGDARGRGVDPAKVKERAEKREKLMSRAAAVRTSVFAHGFKASTQ